MRIGACCGGQHRVKARHAHVDTRNGHFADPHQRLAALCDRVVLMVAGLALDVKAAPP
jgi:adenosyl cobinamide kinase/adenosyl cobinamide phosphate guanylyltransferase